ncbi:MAG: hypothetical protein ABI663_09545 [Chryseolinea sp.]
MKTKFNLLLACMILLTWLNASAQASYLKFGASFNATYLKENQLTNTYPSWELSYERSLGNKWSIALGFNYSKRLTEAPFQTVNTYDYKFTNYDKMFVLEGRYYFLSTDKGPFLQLGGSIFSTKEIFVFKDYTSGMQTTSTHNRTGANVYGGLGLKYPITPKLGFEMTLNITPNINGIEDYGTGGYIRSGVKLTYALGKRK